MAKNSLTDKVASSVAGALTVAVLGGIGLYFASFASKSEVQANTKKIMIGKKETKDLKDEVQKTQAMVCSLAITLVDDREKDDKICNPE